jgi:DNA transformation protein
MAPPDEFIDHCRELLAPLGGVRVRRMFGGHGIYLDDLFIAVVADQVLYLKADATSEPAFRAAGCRAFIYQAKGRVVNLGFWTVPEQAMEAPPEMAPWAHRACGAALRARAAKAAAHAPRPARRQPRRPSKQA